MELKTSKGMTFECDAIMSIPSPPRLYLHLVNISLEDAKAIFAEGNLPIEGYPTYTEVQSISLEGAARVKVSLKIEGT